MSGDELPIIRQLKAEARGKELKDKLDAAKAKAEASNMQRSEEAEAMHMNESEYIDYNSDRMATADAHWDEDERLDAKLYVEKLSPLAKADALSLAAKKAKMLRAQNAAYFGYDGGDQVVTEEAKSDEARTAGYNGGDPIRTDEHERPDPTASGSCAWPEEEEMKEAERREDKENTVTLVHSTQGPDLKDFGLLEYEKWDSHLEETNLDSSNDAAPSSMPVDPISPTQPFVRSQVDDPKGTTEIQLGPPENSAMASLLNLQSAEASFMFDESPRTARQYADAMLEHSQSGTELANENAKNLAAIARADATLEAHQTQFGSQLETNVVQNFEADEAIRKATSGHSTGDRDREEQIKQETSGPAFMHTATVQSIREDLPKAQAPPVAHHPMASESNVSAAHRSKTTRESQNPVTWSDSDISVPTLKQGELPPEEIRAKSHMPTPPLPPARKTKASDSQGPVTPKALFASPSESAPVSQQIDTPDITMDASQLIQQAAAHAQFMAIDTPEDHAAQNTEQNADPPSAKSSATFSPNSQQDDEMVEAPESRVDQGASYPGPSQNSETSEIPPGQPDPKTQSTQSITQGDALPADREGILPTDAQDVPGEQGLVLPKPSPPQAPPTAGTLNQNVEPPPTPPPNITNQRYTPPRAASTQPSPFPVRQEEEPIAGRKHERTRGETPEVRKQTRFGQTDQREYHPDAPIEAPVEDDEDEPMESKQKRSAGKWDRRTRSKSEESGNSETSSSTAPMAKQAEQAAAQEPSLQGHVPTHVCEKLTQALTIQQTAQSKSAPPILQNSENENPPAAARATVKSFNDSTTPLPPPPPSASTLQGPPGMPGLPMPGMPGVPMPPPGMPGAPGMPFPESKEAKAASEGNAGNKLPPTPPPAPDGGSYYSQRTGTNKGWTPTLPPPTVQMKDSRGTASHIDSHIASQNLPHSADVAAKAAPARTEQEITHAAYCGSFSAGPQVQHSNAATSDHSANAVHPKQLPPDTSTMHDRPPGMPPMMPPPAAPLKTVSASAPLIPARPPGMPPMMPNTEEEARLIAAREQEAQMEVEDDKPHPEASSSSAGQLPQQPPQPPTVSHIASQNTSQIELPPPPIPRKQPANPPPQVRAEANKMRNELAKPVQAVLNEMQRGWLAPLVLDTLTYYKPKSESRRILEDVDQARIVIYEIPTTMKPEYQCSEEEWRRNQIMQQTQDKEEGNITSDL